jgi:hypothetical protein
MIEYAYVKMRRADVRPIKASRVPPVRFFMRWATRLNVFVCGVSSGRLISLSATVASLY